MSNNHPHAHAASATLRLMLGAPLLCAFISLFTWIEWAIQGFAPELSPHHGLDYYGLLFLGLSFAGGVITLFAAALLGMLGIIAIAFGEEFLRVLRRWRSYCSDDCRISRTPPISVEPRAIDRMAYSQSGRLPHRHLGMKLNDSLSTFSPFKGRF